MRTGCDTFSEKREFFFFSVKGEAFSERWAWQDFLQEMQFSEEVRAIQ